MSRSGKNALVARLAPALLFVLAAPADAAPIRYDFGGVVTHSYGPEEAGSRFSGSFVYDPEAQAIKTVPEEGGGAYKEYAYGTHHPDDPTPDGSGIEVRIGDEPAPLRIDGLTVESNSKPSPSGEGINLNLVFRGGPRNDDRGEFYLVFRGQNMQGVGSLPPQLLLEQFSTSDLVVLPPLQSAPDLVYLGKIDTLSATPVPEPAWTVAALMVVSLIAAKARRKAA